MNDGITAAPGRHPRARGGGWGPVGANGAWAGALGYGARCLINGLPSRTNVCTRRKRTCGPQGGSPSTVTASAVRFLFDVIETKFLRASSISEFSFSLDPERTSPEAGRLALSMAGPR
jgi:hypothetical protein